MQIIARWNDAVNRDVPLSAPYVRKIIEIIKSGNFNDIKLYGHRLDTVMDTNTLATHLLRLRAVGQKINGVLVYASTGIDGYVMFLSVPELAIPMSYFIFNSCCYS